MTKFNEKEIQRRAELLSQIQPSSESTGRAVERVRDTLINKAKAKKQPYTEIWQTIMNSRLTKLAAAAAIIVAAALAISLLQQSTTPAYAFTDMPELFKKARTIHTKGWVYFPGNKMPDGKEIPPVDVESWVDLENGRVRFTSVGLSSSPNDVRITIAETISDGKYKMYLNHTEKSAKFFKISNYQRMLEKHHTLNQMFEQILGDIDKLDNFVRTEREEIDRVEYDIWQGQFVHSVTKNTRLYKYWLSPRTGESRRVEAWTKLYDGQWALDYEYYIIDRDVQLAAGIFSTEAPQGYLLKNTKETAIPLQLDDGGSVHCNTLTLDPRISFTLSDGSVIVAWHSIDRESSTPQEEFFAGLEFGGELPKLPVEIHGLKPSAWTGNIAYIGHHLAYTQKNGKFIEWGIYIPDGPAPARSEILGYDVLYRFNLGQYKPKWKITCSLDYGILIETEENFVRWVLGAMAELSDDAKAPEGITYARVLKLVEQSRIYKPTL